MPSARAIYRTLSIGKYLMPKMEWYKTSMRPSKSSHSTWGDKNPTYDTSRPHWSPKVFRTMLDILLMLVKCWVLTVKCKQSNQSLSTERGDMTGHTCWEKLQEWNGTSAGPLSVRGLQVEKLGKYFLTLSGWTGMYIHVYVTLSKCLNSDNYLNCQHLEESLSSLNASESQCHPLSFKLISYILH